MIHQLVQNAKLVENLFSHGPKNVKKRDLSQHRQEFHISRLQFFFHDDEEMSE
jgi:hypothetical protein